VRGRPVAVINQTMARLHWPKSSPLNQRIVLGPTNSRAGRLGESQPGATAVTIVGVVEDARQRPDILFETRPQVYLPYWQNVGRVRDMAVAIRTAGDPSGITPAVRAQVRALDPQQPIYRVQEMQTLVDNGMGPKRLSLVLLSLFSMMALVLVIVGLYGVIAYSVARRTHEIGVRLALGAHPRDVLRMLLRQMGSLTLWGVVTGAILAFVAMRWVASQFYGVSPADPLAFGGVAALLSAVAFAASYFPARRAMSVDPLVALRHE
jgi:putative ABC transport system permease protein